MARFPAVETKTAAMEILASGGGPVGTGLVAAAALGAECAWLGALGDDLPGRFLLDDFERRGVSTEYIEIVPGGRSFTSYVILDDEKKTRTCVFDRGDLPKAKMEGANAEAIAGADLLMVDGNGLDSAVEAARRAKESGTAVLYDAGGLYPNVERLVPLADYLIPSEEFALKWTGETTALSAAERLWKEFTPRAVVVTCGAAGGVAVDQNGARRYPAFPVEALDTNGAGDVFHGAFAWAAGVGEELDSACRFASAASAIKCTGLGARASAPNRERVEQFIRERTER